MHAGCLMNCSAEFMCILKQSGLQSSVFARRHGIGDLEMFIPAIV